MANTYTQIHIQAVFAVKYRQSLIQSVWKEELYKYITGIIRNYDHKVLAINGMSDHIHILFGMRPTQSLSNLMQFVKQDSTEWINKKGLTQQKFAWQKGYGAFSYAKSEIKSVIRYIEKQEEHHRNQSFQKEYSALLDTFAVDYDTRYVFDSIW